MVILDYQGCDFLLNILINDIHYSKIKIFVRGKSNIDNPKVEIIYTDFKSLNDYSDLIKGDDCFYCIGTTKKILQINMIIEE